ncbi:hypothetical protein NC653_015103 [Populus alba x Populus x berolinensis]|uniref:Uncharacterized protein n=1 Tax=Populus alba x Populus x berolinensis TaxID=444605 RepID=A0AAD6W4R6_9ROSI|nr:hypothetical protein NC653_015103 [Populus alba x Populus x berolinensis]
MEEQKKLLGKQIEVGIDSDDNEPIGSLFRLKRPRNSKKVKVVLEKIEVREDKLATEDEDLGGMDDTLGAMLENQEEESLLPGESSSQSLDKLEDSISVFYQKKQSDLLRKSCANSSSKQINRVQCLEARLSPGSGVGCGGSKDVDLSTFRSTPVSNVVCKDLEAGDSFSYSCQFEVTAEVAAPASPALGSHMGRLKMKKRRDPCISDFKGEPMGKPCSSYRIWNESHSASGNTDGLEAQTLKNGLKLCSVGKVSTRNTLEQQSKGVSAACISNAEPQISISSGGREVSASSSPNSQNDLQDLASVPKKENVEISDVRRNESYSEDAVSVPDSDIKDGHLAAVHRAMRKPKKRRLGDMAYEGDADWVTLINEQQFLENDQVVEVTDLLEPERSPVEKIKFKEVLKRKGGLQEYLECSSEELFSFVICRVIKLTPTLQEIGYWGSLEQKTLAVYSLLETVASTETTFPAMNLRRASLTNAKSMNFHDQSSVKSNSCAEMGGSQTLLCESKDRKKIIVIGAGPDCAYLLHDTCNVRVFQYTIHEARSMK